MDQERFEAEVVGLASEGVKLTVANVAARTRLSPRKAEQMLDAMVASHHLDSEVDERAGLVVYQVRGLDDHVAVRGKLAALEKQITAGAQRAAREVLVADAGARVKGALATTGERSVLAAGLLGLVLGPVGLIYAAPWEVVGGGLLAYLVMGILVKIPLLGALLVPLWGLLHLVTIAACILYAIRYNQHGRRVPLLPESNGK